MGVRKHKALSISFRTVQFLFGVFVMSFGIALTVRALIGTTPISSIPVVLAEALPLTVGEFTIILNLLMVVAQLFILRKKFPLLQGLQVLAAFAFGWSCDLSLWLLQDLVPPNYLISLILSLVGSMLLGIGVFIQVSAKAVYVPPEGLVAAIAKVSGKDFGTLKIINDWSLILIAVALSFVFLGELVGVREGTLIGAFLVGLTVKACRNLWNKTGVPGWGERPDSRAKGLEVSEDASALTESGSTTVVEASDDTDAIPVHS